jgi:hypothetical protein
MEKSEDVQNIKNLLSQVNTIRKGYEKVAQATGENFNVFSILGLERREVQAHSAFIAHLLNANGRHGFGDAFLIEFISVLKEKNSENQDKKENIKEFEFKTERSIIKKEHFISKKYIPKKEEVLSKAQGGYIDILISENSSSDRVIMIENKIDAEEQEHQLRRYHNAFPNGLLVYLTLDGKISSEESAETIPYRRMSYENDIVKWLDQCQKIAVDNPVVRETIKQYKNLIKKLTNQNINSDMNKEILKTIVSKGKKQNFESFISLVVLKNEIFRIAVKEHLYPTLDNLCQEYDLKHNFDKEKFANKGSDWLSLSLNSSFMDKNNIEIGFSFNTKTSANNLIIGFKYLNFKIKNNFDYELLKKNYENELQGKRIETDGWPAFQYVDQYRNWEYLSVLKEVIHGDFKKDLSKKIYNLVHIAEKSF